MIIPLWLLTKIVYNDHNFVIINESVYMIIMTK